MTLVVAVAAAGALVLLCLIVALVRGRRPDEDVRFRHAAYLTSEWSKEQQSAPREQATEPVDSR